MVQAGETIENPVTRKRVVFLATAEETNGELLRVEHVFAPGGFEILSGLGRDGRLNKRSVPNPILGAVLAQEYDAEARVAPTKEILLTRLPAPLIRLLIGVLAPLGRLLGYGSVLRGYISPSGFRLS